MSLSSERYAANLALINKKDPRLAKHLDEMPLTSIRLQPIGEQQDELYGQIYCPKQRHWVPLGAEQNAVQTAIHDVDQLYSDRQKIFCLVGMGLGYFAVEFARRLRGYQRMAIFDLSPSVYKASMYCVDLAPILGDNRVDTFIGETIEASIDRWWQTLSSHEKFYIAEPMRASYTAGFEKEQYERIALKTYDMIRYHKVGLATWKAFGPLIGNNDFGNMPEYLNLPGGEELDNIWTNRPAVCVAAGPSLKKNLRYLMDPALRKNVCVLSVGTVYAQLKAMGIEPDVVTTIDFQRLNYTDQFHKVPLDPHTALVYLHSTYPETVRRWPGPKFVTLNSSDSVQWIEKTTQTNKMHASSVQTVAHLNLVMAIRMGCNPIMLIGQDLAMAYDDHHAPGARVQDVSPEENPDGHVRAKDIFGNDCWTRHSFLSMRTVFAQIMRANPDRQYVNCTEGGVGVDGVPNMPLANCLRRIAGRQWPDSDAADLRREIERRYRDFKPDIDWGAVINKVSDLRVHAQGVAREARVAIEKHDALALAADTTPEEDIAALKEEVKAHEKQVTAYPEAFALYAVRSFNIVELMSQVPPPDGTTEAEMKQLTYDRFVSVCQSISDAADDIDHVLSASIKRFRDIHRAERPTTGEIHRMIVRGSYDVASKWIAHAMAHPVPDDDPGTVIDLLLRVLWHQQQYEALDVMSRRHGKRLDMADKGRRRIDDLKRAVVPTLPLYFHQGEDGGNTQKSDSATESQPATPVEAVVTVAPPTNPQEGVQNDDNRVQPADPGHANGSQGPEQGTQDLHQGGPGVQDRDADQQHEQ